ncbi:6978_t:CDS:1 [Ambispora gerdemannii]|uniref:6978_t:CDS:1 n=1 Tax=Ambispora gerdemannii TaxID=144530 RepID=A0A9N8V1W5_9GLOM|nr:6978_t:CDS:1 [Ambispora gerdemannii]
MAKTSQTIKKTNQPFRINKKSKTVFDFNLSNLKYKQAVARILDNELTQLDHPLPFTRLELEQLLDFGRRVSCKKIPRPQNKWVLYRKAQGIKLSGNGTGVKPQFHAVAKIIGNQWQVEELSVKQFFEFLADIGKRAHREAFPQYKYRPIRRSDPSSERNYEWIKEDCEAIRLAASSDTQSVKSIDEIANPSSISIHFKEFCSLVDHQQQMSTTNNNINYDINYRSIENPYEINPSIHYSNSPEIPCSFMNMLQQEPETPYPNDTHPSFSTSSEMHFETHFEMQIPQFPPTTSLEDMLNSWPFTSFTSELDF